MLKRRVPLACLIAVLSPACHNLTVERIDDAGSCDVTDMSKPTADMAVAPPKCAAAKGLAGDNLLCVDFDKVTQLSSLAGWDFTCTSGAGWVSVGGKLQVNNFSTFMSTCSATLPTLSSSDYQKYSAFTLAVIQRADLNETQQKAQIMLGADDPAKRLLAHMTGAQPRQYNVYQIAKVDLPVTAMGSFQPLLKISSGVAVGGTAQGWQIESIAIQGMP